MKTVSKKIALMLGLFITTVGFSQDNTTFTPTDSRNELRFGLKAGVNYSNVYDEEGDDFVADGKAGFVAGAFLSVPLGTYIGFQPEIMYSQKGFQAKGSGSILGIPYDYDYKRTSTYLDIPLQLQIKPIEQLTILAGPQYSYLLETKNEFNGNSTTQQEEEINNDNYKKNIFGFVVGADFNLENLVISARAGWDITKSDTDGDTTNPRYKNQVLQLTLGYRF